MPSQIYTFVGTNKATVTALANERGGTVIFTNINTDIEISGYQHYGCSRMRDADPDDVNLVHERPGRNLHVIVLRVDN